MIPSIEPPDSVHLLAAQCFLELHYNLACYECQLRRMEQAKAWLEKALKLGAAKKMKVAALDEPDLEPLWGEIATI